MRQAPIATNPNPIVEAFVRACIRDSASGNRTTPTAETNVSAAPITHQQLADHPPLPLDEAGDDCGADESDEREHHGDLEERAAPGVDGIDDDHAQANHEHPVDGDCPIGQ